MLKKMTRSKLLQIWFTAVVLVIAAGITIGAQVTVATGALLLAMCLVPPAVVWMLWPVHPPVSAGDVIRSDRQV